MIRQAAPPARRWLLLVVALLVAPWVGQGVAVAYSMSVTPQSGPAGTTVSVELSEFGVACIVTFDGEPVAGAEGCDEETTLVFDVPEAASVGNHEIQAEGFVIDGVSPTQTMTFRVTATPTTAAPPTTVAPVNSPPVSTSTANIQVGPVGGATTPGSSTTRPTTEASTAPPTTVDQAATAAGIGTAGSGPVFAAACPPQQVALMRFGVSPTRGRPGAKIAGTTSWGSVGTCTPIRSLRVMLDGKTVPGAPPEAGTSGGFEMTIPRDARAGPHTLALVADDNPSFELATVAFEVEKAKASLLPIVALIAAGAALLLVVLLLVRRRRRRRRSAYDEDEWAGGMEVPDIADITAVATPIEDPLPGLFVEDNPTMPVVPLVVASGRDGSFYLLERQNPHAPRQPNGKRGWYRSPRSAVIRGIVVGTVEPHTAGAAASELAIGEQP
ncbi:MAG TPA: hypothetical protein VF244_05025, partial [Acidimicrobiales bacterium]